MTISNPSRPEMQRTEVGPILNHAGNAVYGGLLIPQFFGYRDNEQAAMTDFEKFRVVIAETVDSMSRSRHVNLTRQHTMAFSAVNGLFHSQTLQGKLTHYTLPNDVLSEGVKSGIIFPANAVLRLLAEQQGIIPDETPDIGLQIDFRDVSSTLDDSIFQNSLVRLSKVPNGTYEHASVEARMLCSSAIGRKLRVYPIFDGFKLTAKTKEVLKEILNEKREQSLGCPVAHATFPEIGEYALTYARLLGIHPDELRQQRISAIRSGVRYLARVFASVDQETMKTKQA